MDFVEQDRQALYLIYNDVFLVGRNLLAEPSGILAEGQEGGGVQHVVDAGLAELMSDQEALPRLARTEEKV
jgi:hypothetical protein